MGDGTRRRTVRGALLAVLIGTVVLVVAAEVFLRFAMPQWNEFYSGRFMQWVQVPGHSPVVIGRPGFDGWFAQNDGDFRVHIHINRAGLRDPEPVSAAAGRIWVVGDSVTFGWGVAQSESYTSAIAAESGRPTYNVASPGADVCGYQSLIARMPEGVRPSAVVVGLVIENDVRDYDCRRDAGMPPAPAPSADFTLARLKRFLTDHSATYNVLAVSLKRVPAVVELLTGLGLVARPQVMHDPVGRKHDARAAESTARELDRLRRMLPAGTPFAVLVIPARFDIRDNDAFFVGERRAARAALEKRGIAVIDPAEAFRAAGFASTHFRHDGHWNARGHAIAGHRVAEWIRVAPAGR